MTHLIIAETGEPPNNMAETYGHYSDMFIRLLEDVRGPLTAETVRVFEAPYPALPAPTDGTALLITGSPAGVYENHPWIAPLEEAVRTYLAAGCRVLGICFGHQLIAQALGGTVVKSEKGWGVGVHTYDRLLDEAPIADGPSRFSCAVSHQDQVISLPPDAKRLAGSAFCPNGVISYAEGLGLSFQMHPEFLPAFGQALMAAREASIMPETYALGQASYQGGSDRLVMARWISQFLFGEAA